MKLSRLQEIPFGLYAIEYGAAFLIVLSYLSTRTVSILAAILAFLFIIFYKNTNRSIALLFFLLPFSSVFSVADNTTSLYMLLRVACVLKLIQRKKLSLVYVVLLLAFLIYAMGSMFIAGTDAWVRIFNLALWFLMGLAVIELSSISGILDISRSFAQGTLLSCVIGMNLAAIPNLQRSLISISYFNADTQETILRFSGLWNDPNGLTVLVIASMFMCLLALNLGKMRTLEFYLYELFLSIFGLMTLSKSCMILLCVFWGYVFVSKSNMKLLHKVLACVGGAAVLLGIWVGMSDKIDLALARFQSAQTAVDLTTNRTDIWKMYLDHMNLGTWLVGKGINAVLPGSRAAHNTLIQLVYNVGLIGATLWLLLFGALYRKAAHKHYTRVFVPLLAVGSTMFFLDGMFLELFYLIIPLLMKFSLRIVVLAKEENV